MTLCIAWVREKKRSKRELCVIGDSCLSCGDRFYGAPKLFSLGREDCVIACSGSTNYFYPIAIHLQNSVELNKKVKDRAIDFLDYKNNILDLINKTLQELKEFQGYDIERDDGPGFNMILGGYSSRIHDFRIYEIKYNKLTRKMGLYKCPTILGTPVCVIGDEGIISSTRFMIYSAVQNKNQDVPYIDMEPLSVLCDIIKDPTISTVSGYPQMIKIYPFLRTLPFAFIHRENGEMKISYMGRIILQYETIPYPMIDLKTGETKYMKFVGEEFKRTYETTRTLDVFYNNIAYPKPVSVSYDTTAFTTSQT